MKKISQAPRKSIFDPNVKYQRLSEIRDLIPQFKDYFYNRLKESPNYSKMKLIDDFNESIAPKVFRPYPAQYRNWYRKWEVDIAEQVAGAKLAISHPEVKTIRTRDKDNNLIIPTEEELEGGAKNLAGELMNDAMTILKADQRYEHLYDDESIIKRRNYVLNVFNHVMRAVQQKEAINIRKKQESREHAGFLMDLIRRSTAGKITPEEVALMKKSFTNNE